MKIIYVLAFVFIVLGLAIQLKLHPQAIVNDGEKLINYFKSKTLTMEQLIKKAKKQFKRKKQSLLSKFINDIFKVLKSSGKEASFTTVCFASAVLFLIGILVAISLNNFYLVPVLAVGLSLLPVLYVQIMASRYRQEINLNLETALSLLTASYMRGDNTFLSAVEENLVFLNPPVQGIFKEFMFKSKMISSDTESLLLQMKQGIDNIIFHEWIDAIIMCHEDHNLKVILPPIVARLSDLRNVAEELKVLLHAPKWLFLIMITAAVFSPSLIFVLNQRWWEILVDTSTGKIVISISVAVLFLAISLFIKYTKPITQDYE